MGDVVQFDMSRVRPYPGWRIRVDETGIAHHEKIPPTDNGFVLVPGSFDMLTDIAWVYQ